MRVIGNVVTKGRNGAIDRGTDNTGVMIPSIRTYQKLTYWYRFHVSMLLERSDDPEYAALFSC